MTVRGKSVPISSIALNIEQDVVLARRRARDIAAFGKFDRQDQVRIATAVSEIARNAIEYGRGGRVEFTTETGSSPMFAIKISDHGPGIPDLQDILDGGYESTTGMGVGITGARRLMDDFAIETSEKSGTVVELRKAWPAGSPLAGSGGLRDLAAKLASSGSPTAIDELHESNVQLVKTLEELHDRESELRRVNQELEDTNRGVMALYTELEDRNTALRRADELKSRFLSHISHEFRTPLNSILALTRILDTRTDGDLTAEQEKQIGYIRRAAEDLTQIVNDLLDLAKVEAGKTTLHFNEFKVGSLLGTLRGLMRPLQTNPNVDLIVEEPIAEVVMNSDEDRIGQILRNLVSNALKFTEKGEVRVRTMLNREGICFLVSDTGIGVAEQDQERIFLDFAQVEHSIQRKVHGTGLGLPLSRRLAELLGGSLRLKSTLGVGSEFSLQLPASQLIAGGLPAEFEDGDLRLLVIDDDPVSRYLVTQLLREEPVTISECESGSDGLERARFDRPGLILLDLTMPGLSGFETLQRLREQPETDHTPVIVYTSRTLPESDRQLFARQHIPVLPKAGLDRQHLLDAIRKATEDKHLIGIKEAP